MMRFPHDPNGDRKNAIGAKQYLEFAVHILEIGYFNPVVFCHDNFWFDRNRHAQVAIGFINLISFLYSCGVTIETTMMEPSEIEAELYRGIMRDGDIPGTIRCYELLEMDFTSFSLLDSEIPKNCTNEDFALVKLYLVLRSGSALNKRAIENITKKKYTDSGMLTLRKQMENITGRKIAKRKDNSYEMR